ncbi:hypothetical protein PCE1_003565 [Barthelona sp. PCE]
MESCGSQTSGSVRSWSSGHSSNSKLRDFYNFLSHLRNGTEFTKCIVCIVDDESKVELESIFEWISLNPQLCLFLFANEVPLELGEKANLARIPAIIVYNFIDDSVANVMQGSLNRMNIRRFIIENVIDNNSKHDIVKELHSFTAKKRGRYEQYQSGLVEKYSQPATPDSMRIKIRYSTKKKNNNTRFVYLQPDESVATLRRICAKLLETTARNTIVYVPFNKHRLLLGTLQDHDVSDNTLIFCSTVT